MKMKPKQWYILIAVIVVIVALTGGGIWLVASKKTAPQQIPAVMDQTQQVQTLAPDSIGLAVAFRSDNKAMKFTVGNASGINSIEYQISYMKLIDGQQVPEGLIGTVDMNPGDKTASIGYREFGTCSSGVCRYDKVVSPVKLTLKLVKSDGKIYQVEKTVDLP
jgi:hypothetical protein